MPESVEIINTEGIYLKAISHCLGQRILFDNLTVAFVPCAITALSGKSGSGKSTLLQMVNGLVKPDSGLVYLAGLPLDYKNLYKIRLTIGYAVQQVGLFPHLTVYRNIVLLGMLSGWEKQKMQSRAEELMDIMELTPSYMDKYPHQLSGGEQQRVGLCRTVFLNPPFVLLDEPFSALDRETKFSIYDKILLVQRREPRCIVLVTHDSHEAKKLGDVRLTLEQGKITPITS